MVCGGVWLCGCVCMAVCCYSVCMVARRLEHNWKPRPLKRTIQRLVENPLAEALLSGKFTAGDVIQAARAGEVIRFTKASSVSQVA